MAPVESRFRDSEAGRFLRKCTLMAALVLATGAVILVGIPPDRDDYLAVVGSKVALLENTPAPRIVFVGGSNLAFGLDSALVEEELGKRVVNMGMGFNMGLRFMLDLIEPRLRDDDLVVLVPEYNLFFGLLDGDERLLDVLELYPPGLQYVHSRQQMFNMARNLPDHVRLKFTRMLQTLGRTAPEDCVYCPRAFNEKGDNVAHLNLESRDVSDMPFLRSAHRGVDDEAIEVVNDFARRAGKRGARVVLIFPCLPDVHYERRRKAIEDLYATMGRKLTVPMLSSPRDHVYPVGDFYDWVYHLNRRGRALRTARVVEQLRPVVEKSPTT